MKAVILQKQGGPEQLVLETRGRPEPAAGEILVENRAIGVNFIDIYKRRGLYPVTVPSVLGEEAAGVVTAVGSEVESFKPGDRVAWLGAGAYAEEAIVAAGMAAKIPDDIPDDIAAATFLKGLTAHMLARQVYPLSKGKRALVHAAAGGVGTLLCQWASHLGAEVIAVVGMEEKAQVARDAGAAHVLVRDKTDDIAGAVRALTNGEGVHVVYDSVGEATFKASLDSLAMRGMMVTYGNASGPAPALAPLELARRGSLFLTRPTLFHYATPGRLQEMASELFDMIAKGVLRPAAPRVFPLPEAKEAHQLLESGSTTGSIVLHP